MKINDLKELIKTISESNINLFEYEENGTKIKLSKELNMESVSTKYDEEKIETKKCSEKLESYEPKEEIVEIVEDKNIKEILSPMVGMFYGSPSPNEENFVKVGSRVKKGDVVCIIEAMKIMNEIESDVDGIVSEINVKDEEMVQYGQCLIKIEAC